MNVGRIPDANLDVGLSTKSRVSVYVLAFGEDAPNGVERLFAGPFSCCMEKVDDGTVKFPKKKVVSTNVFRHLSARCGDYGLEACVRLFDGVDSV